MPLLTTEVGVMAPSDRVIAGVVEAVATEPDIPLAATTDREVTVPDPPLPVTVAVRVPLTRESPVPTDMLSTFPVPAVDLPRRVRVGIV